MRTIAGIPSGPLDLEVSSWRRVWRTFRVENLMGDIVNFEGGSDEVGPLGRRLELEAKIFSMTIFSNMTVKYNNLQLFSSLFLVHLGSQGYTSAFFRQLTHFSGLLSPRKFRTPFLMMFYMEHSKSRKI